MVLRLLENFIFAARERSRSSAVRPDELVHRSDGDPCLPAGMEHPAPKRGTVALKYGSHSSIG